VSPVDWVLEPFSYQFMLHALTTTVVASVVCALLSCWLVLIGWSLMGDAVAHAVLPGVVLAYVVGAPFALGAAVFGFLAVGLIGAVRGTKQVKEDAAIGIVFTTLFAVGLVLSSITPSQVDLDGIVFGNVLGISFAEVIQIGIVALVVGTVLLVKRRDLTLYAFDPAHARSIGIDPRVLSAVLLGALAMTVIVALQVVGVVLVVGMLIIPGATASLMTKRFTRMLLVAPFLSASCSVIGLLVSYWADASPGGLVIAFQGALFGVVLLGRLCYTRLNLGAMGPRAAAQPSTATDVPAAL